MISVRRNFEEELNLLNKFQNFFYKRNLKELVEA